MNSADNRKHGWQEFFLGLLSGIILIFIGFYVQTIWDVNKIIDDNKHRQEAFRVFVKREIGDNKEILSINKKIIVEDNAAINDRTRTITPLVFFKNEAWGLLKINPSPDFFEDSFVIKIGELASMINQINQYIQVRENYRIYNREERLPIIDYYGAMRVYNKALSKEMDKLETRLNEVVLNEHTPKT